MNGGDGEVYFGRRGLEPMARGGEEENSQLQNSEITVDISAQWS